MVINSRLAEMSNNRLANKDEGNADEHGGSKGHARFGDA
jgi:hypothetical protein